MNLIAKILLKLKIESRFLLEQKWGLVKPSDPHALRKTILRKYLSGQPSMIDCGAHVGADSIELARLFPRGTVYSFEPVPDIFGHLSHNARKYPNIKCFQLALGNSDGTATMHVSSGHSDASSSLLAPSGHLANHPGVLFEDKIEARVLTLDSWAAEQGIGSLEFLWLDMQGFEWEMLKASKKILPTVKAIYTEVSVRDTYEGAAPYPVFREWLAEQGFKVVLELIPEGTDMGNVLFSRR